MTACAGMLASSAKASQNRSLRSFRRFHRKTSISAATTARAKVSVRLPNSMMPWIPISGVFTRDPAVHRGHVGQPRPDAVSRTAPPVTISTDWPISEATERPAEGGVHAPGQLVGDGLVALLQLFCNGHELNST